MREKEEEEEEKKEEEEERNHSPCSYFIVKEQFSVCTV